MFFLICFLTFIPSCLCFILIITSGVMNASVHRWQDFCLSINLSFLFGAFHFTSWCISLHFKTKPVKQNACSPPNITVTLTWLSQSSNRHPDWLFVCSLTDWLTDCVRPLTDGSPLTWWLDWEGEKRSYWGGFLPGVQQCSCSLEENCMDMNYFCNCDADTDSW